MTASSALHRQMVTNRLLIEELKRNILLLQEHIMFMDNAIRYLVSRLLNESNLEDIIPDR